MSLISWLQNLRSALRPRRGQRHHRRQGWPRAAAYHPNLEVLEDRCLPASSVMADFNGDSLLDVAAVNFPSSEVSIYLGNGDGTYQPAQNYNTYHTSDHPNCIAAGDFNGDGKLDLVTGSAYWEQGELGVLLGNGDGSFQWL